MIPSAICFANRIILSHIPPYGGADRLNIERVPRANTQPPPPRVAVFDPSSRRAGVEQARACTEKKTKLKQ